MVLCNHEAECVDCKGGIYQCCSVQTTVQKFVKYLGVITYAERVFLHGDMLRGRTYNL